MSEIQFTSRGVRALAVVVALVTLLTLASGCGGGTAVESPSSVHWLKLDGVVNARDLGGWKFEDGKTVPYGRVFRSGRISGAAPAAIDKLRALGLKTTIDLRSDLEVRASGRDEQATGAFAKTVRAPLKGIASAPGYVDMLGNQQSSIATVFRTLAEESSYPLLVHCTAGKDRTGVVSALLLELLGVPREQIAQDYLLSGNSGLEVEKEWLESVFKAIDAAGGIGKYLSSIGITTKMQNAIREAIMKAPEGTSVLPLQTAA